MQPKNNGADVTKPVEMTETERLKQTLGIIERFFHAMNDTAGFAPKHFDAITMGMTFLAQVHADMFSKLPAEEQAKAKKAKDVIEPEIVG